MKFRQGFSIVRPAINSLQVVAEAMMIQVIEQETKEITLWG